MKHSFHLNGKNSDFIPSGGRNTLRVRLTFVLNPHVSIWPFTVSDRDLCEMRKSELRRWISVVSGVGPLEMEKCVLRC